MLLSRRASWVSVSILVGIKLRRAIFSGRMSCVMARVSVITKMFSLVSVWVAGSSLGIRMGMVGLLCFESGEWG